MKNISYKVLNGISDNLPPNIIKECDRIDINYNIEEYEEIIEEKTYKRFRFKEIRVRNGEPTRGGIIRALMKEIYPQLEDEIALINEGGEAYQEYLKIREDILKEAESIIKIYKENN